jgi:AbrB family looped-hinge helix DNA binding protein
MATYTATITAKGQLTIPVAIYRNLGLRKGDPVWVSTQSDRLLIQPARLAAVRYDAAYQRFSMRWTTPDGAVAVGVVGNVLPRRLLKLSCPPAILARAKREPDAWVALGRDAGERWNQAK